MSKLLSLMGVKAGETKLAGLSAFYALLIGLSQVWLKTIPVSLFLTNFNAETLPFAYIASAIVLVCLGIVYSVLERKLSPIKLLYFFIILPATTFFIFWLFLESTPSKFLYLALFICASASFDIFDLELWGMLNRLFTLDQAKRMFGTIGLCQTVPGIAGNLFLPFLLILIGPNKIILSVSICIALATLLLSLIFRHYSARFINPVEKNSEVKEKSKVKWLNNSYLINNMLFAIFSLFVYTIVDISFYNVNKVVFPTEIQLASFLGIFFGISNTFDLLCRGLIGPLVINKLGVKTGLLIRSVAVGAVALIILLLLPFHINFYTIFLLVALMKLFDEGISNSILRQSVLILYQPLLPSLRSWLQSKIELFVIPLSTIAASLIFIAIQYYFSLNLAYITLLILIMIAATLRVTFSLQKGYIENLREAIAKEYIVFKSQILDKNHVDLIMEKLKNGKPNEIVYSLDLLEKMDRSYFVEGLKICLNYPHSRIKETALNKLQNFQAAELILELHKILQDDSDRSLKAPALRALLFQKEMEFQEFKAYLYSDDSLLMDEAIIVCLKSCQDPALLKMVQEKLHHLVQSSFPNERIRAAKILGKLKKDTHHHLPLLLADQNPTVALAAIETVPSFQEPELYQKLSNALNRDELRASATLAFIKAQDKGLPALKDSLALAIDKGDQKMAHSLYAIIGNLQTPASIQLLLTHLRTTQNPSLQWEILQALDFSGYKPNTNEKQELNPFIVDAAAYMKKLLKWSADVQNQRDFELLSSSLKKQIQSTQNRIFLVLGILYPKEEIKDIYFYSKHPDIDKVSYSHELLENILNKEHKNLILPMFKQSEILTKKLNAEDLFQEILSVPMTEISKTLKSTVLYLIARLKIKKLIALVEQYLNDRDKMISETAQWSINNLKEETT